MNISVTKLDYYNVRVNDVLTFLLILEFTRLTWKTLLVKGGILMLNFIKNIFRDENTKELEKVQPIVDEVNVLETDMQGLSDQELKNKTTEFRKRISAGETLDELLPEAFAVVREAAQRSTEQKFRHFDVQLIGGVILHQGRIAEMKTGEGKTLAATLPVYLNALTGKGVHVVTVNDYLARRDSEWMGQIYQFLGLTV